MWPIVLFAVAAAGVFYLLDDKEAYPAIRSEGSRKRRNNMKFNPRTFISFDFDHDETTKMLFAGQAKNSRTPFEISDWSSKSALPQSKWEALVRDKIAKCNVVIVLVGRSMASATGVAKEIAMAHSLHVPVFGVYVDGAGAFSTLPTGLARNRVINWSWDGVASAIDQVMKEGKNAA